ncbi:restriction system modified-DNA reader domain-containing protein [Actinokineospora alba]|uniref:restriction system modified-DNA reader domain-containing protein n=1 Tax=Actinokineospora alba TaxID=504798 RepID=UPI000B86F771|nr:hypothetical protein [Actinokineospora alba]
MTILRREGLPPDGVILAPSVAATPMRHPDNAWAMLVLAVDVLDDTDPDRQGEVALFAGCWLTQQRPASLSEGDLVLVLTAPEGESPPDDLADVEMLLAHRSRWLRVGEWEGVDPRWPWAVAPTAAAIMGLHTEATDVAAAARPPADRSLGGWSGNGGIYDLLAAGLVRAGEKFTWDRPGRGARHTAKIHPDGTLILADGRAYANPSGALTALGGKHHNGWKGWKRTSDGRPLGDLRAELRTLRGLTSTPRRV